LTAAPAVAWGPNGHRVAALIAENHLEPGARAEVKLLLGGQTLAEASTWADDAREQRNWRQSAPWHYVNIPDGQTYASSRKNRRGDVLQAIERFRKTLADRRASPAKRVDALRFLVHFVADLHQPLHVGRAEDRGGNDVEVRWFGRPSNLHQVWDSGILGRQRMSAERWAASLDRAGPERVDGWLDSSPLDWAVESQELRPQVYRIGDGNLGERYLRENLLIVRRRLLQAGVRLAALLEQTLR
jgi:hypothetical protein